MRIYNNISNNSEHIKQRCKSFIAELGTPVTVFCRNIGISPSAYHHWQKGMLKLADSTVERISEYLDKYGF